MSRCPVLPLLIGEMSFLLYTKAKNMYHYHMSLVITTSTILLRNTVRNVIENHRIYYSCVARLKICVFFKFTGPCTLLGMCVIFLNHILRTQLHYK